MKNTIVVVAMMIGSIAYGQKCKNKIKVNAFDETKTMTTEKHLIGWSSAGNVHLFGMKSKEISYLVFHFTTRKILSVDANDEFSFKTDKGEIITLTGAGQNVSSSGLGAAWILPVLIPLDDVNIEELINSKIVAMRVRGNDIYQDLEVKKKRSSYIAETVRCLTIE